MHLICHEMPFVETPIALSDYNCKRQLVLTIAVYLRRVVYRDMGFENHRNILQNQPSRACSHDLLCAI